MMMMRWAGQALLLLLLILNQRMRSDWIDDQKKKKTWEQKRQWKDEWDLCLLYDTYIDLYQMTGHSFIAMHHSSSKQEQDSELMKEE